MEAGHRGAGREQSMGLNIMLPFEQDSNPIIRGDHKLVHMKYFFTRKLMFVKECDGSLSAARWLWNSGRGARSSHSFTNRKTGSRSGRFSRCSQVPHSGRDWDLRLSSKRLLEEGMISPDDLSLYKLTDNTSMKPSHEILNFYRMFHSMRYVKNKIVLRLQSSFV